MGCSRIFFILLAVQSIRCNFTLDYTIEGADYVGKSGNFNYAVFAMIGVNHARAISLCNTLYPGGRLAWMGDLKFKLIKKLAYKIMIFHYMSLNNYFWIDGDLNDSNCDPQRSSCTWIAYDSSLVESAAARSFVNRNVTFHKPRKTPEKFWPVLLLNKFKEYKMKGEIILSAAPEKEEAGFICSYKEKENTCPIGFSRVTKRVPRYMTTFKITKPDVCGPTPGF
ncbi:hypothetical protein ACTXT7_008005 [Hymenolepis weldensis]